MRVTASLLLCLGLIVKLSAQLQITTVDNADKTISIFVENTTGYEYSLKLEFDLEGMKASVPLPLTSVIPGKAKMQLLTLTPVARAYGYSYKSLYVEGDVNGQHDNAHVYELPYPASKAYVIDQGYLESPTHMGKYALDFHMEEGEVFTAVRSGKVIKVVQQHKKGCPREDCNQYNNYVLVRHADGSVADYSHMQKDGALVREGDEVEVGQPLGKCGSTGWATGPHLHLEVYIPSFSGNQSVNANYRLEQAIGVPKKGQKYVR